MPTSLETFSALGYYLPHKSRTSVCCGTVCLRPNKTDGAAQEAMKQIMDTAYVSKMYKTLLERVVLVNTFFGLDDAQSVPPNIIVTGPLTKRKELLYPNALKEKAPDGLFSWMEQSERPILYISLGSQILWQEWECQAILQGIKKFNNSQSSEQEKVRVVWHINRKTCPVEVSVLLPTNDDTYFIADSVPEAEVLAHPKVMAALTHCDFTSILNCLRSGVQVIAFPHHYAQCQNAKHLDSKLSVNFLIDEGLASRILKSSDELTWPQPVFTSERFVDSLINIKHSTGHQSMEQLNYDKMERKTLASGGARQAVVQVKNVYISLGGKHLLTKDYLPKVSKVSRTTSNLWMILAFLFVCAYIYLFTSLFILKE